MNLNTMSLEFGANTIPLLKSFLILKIYDHITRWPAACDDLMSGRTVTIQKQAAMRNTQRTTRHCLTMFTARRRFDAAPRECA